MSTLVDVTDSKEELLFVCCCELLDGIWATLAALADRRAFAISEFPRYRNFIFV